jgi:ferredoxin
MKLHVDSELCQGHNRCAALAPQLVVIDDLGYASEVNGGVVPDDLEKAARLAEANCPEHAIILSD